MTPELKARIDQEVKTHPIVIYMKGNALFPRCGFSAIAVEALRPLGELYTVDVLTDPELRDGIKEYSSWPTIPQVYIGGKFVGGSDIVRDLAERGELEALVKGSAQGS
jgi:monothiol glutaredoxin